MPHFRKLLCLPLLLILTVLPRLSFAALIPRFDLESLCYLSTDAVEATIVRHHTAGHMDWDDRFTATVTRSLAGQYKPGDKINALDLYLYDPNAHGQRCILFITRKEFQLDVLPSKTIAPQAIDMLLVDGHNRVRRYFQIDNPGGLDAEGYEPDSESDQIKPGDAAAEMRFPTLVSECANIEAKWAAVDRLRPLLARKPTRADIPLLQALVRVRRYAIRTHIGLQNMIGGVAEDRLAELHVSTK